MRRPLIVTLLAAGTAFAASQLEVRGLHEGKEARSAKSVEASILRSEAEGLDRFYTRTAAWFVVAGRGAWKTRIQPGLEAALGPGGGEEALAAVFADLPLDVKVAGPDASGVRVQIDLPDKKGEALVAAYLPDRLARSRSGAALLDRKRPDGLFVSGFKTRADDEFTALTVPGRPRGITRGAVPDLDARPLPEGPVAAFAGKFGRGRDAADLAEELDRFADRDALTAGRMRTLLDDEPLAKTLRSRRAEVDSLRREGDTYRTLVLEPDSWAFEATTLKHPARYVAVAAPLVATVDGERQEVIVAAIGVYTPLFLVLEEAALHAGKPTRELARAAHEGELPFLRMPDELLFHRGHVERWAAGRHTRGEGKVLDHRGAVKRAERWAKDSRSRGLQDALDGALPFRMVAIPEDERAEMADRRRVARGRVYEEDLRSWLAHQDPTLGGEPVWMLRDERPAAELAGRFLPADGRAAIVATSDPEGWGEVQSTGVAKLDLVQLYVPGSCRPGGTVIPVVEFDVDGANSIPVRLEWDLTVAGRNLRRDVVQLPRGPGSHEAEFEVPCPDEAGSSELAVALYWDGPNLTAEGSATIRTSGAAARSYRELSMPLAKACVEQDLDFDEGDDFAVSEAQGLSPAEISQAVGDFSPETLRCQPEREVSGSLSLELTVGCDGRVLEAEVLEDLTTDVGGTFAACVAETFRYAPFPAHARRGGVVFQIPLRYD